MKKIFFVLLAFLILAGIIISPVSASETLYQWSNNQISGEEHWESHIHAWIESNISESVYWNWFGMNSQRGLVLGTNQTNTPITVVCDGSEIIDGTITTVFEGWDLNNYVNISFGTEKPAFNYSGVCSISGYTGIIRQYYGGNNFIQNPASPTMPFRIYHSGVGLSSGSGYLSTQNTSAVVSPVASFTCTPTSQYPDADVVCTDTSTNTPTDWYWSIDAEAMGIDGWQTSTSQNFTWQSAFPGLYSVNLRVNNSAGNDWENKSNYVSISENATPNNCNIPVVPGLIRSWAQCVDSQTSGAIAGCDLSLYDLEGGAWSNVTDRFDGTWCIDTYPGHHFHAYGSADGYTPDPTYRLNLPVSSSVVYELLMHPGYVPAAADGKVWLYVIVNDADTGASLQDAHVSISGSGQTTKSDVTDSTGSIHIQWVNASTAYVTASKSGYTSGSKTVTTSDFGPDTVRIELHRSIVTPTATMTTGPGGTVPTTLAPGLNPDGSYPAGYANTQGTQMMNLLAENGYNLVMLCIVVTMIALFKMISK